MKQIDARINFHFLMPCRLPERLRLKAFIISLFEREKHQVANLSIVFCSDPYLLRLNNEFLNHHDYTDILTFPFSATNSRLVSGEIYISVDRVRENALDLNLSFQEELHRVIFHGTLHLCRYKDKSKREQSLMRAKEDFYLRKYFGGVRNGENRST
jgi:rRNA maturation RNase YbeY